MLCDEFFQEFLIKVRDSANLPSIYSTHAIKKEVRRSEDKDLAAQNYILVERDDKQRGILDPKGYCRKLWETLACLNRMQDQKIREKQKDPSLKRILIVDDDPDITLTFKVGLDGYYYDKRNFDVYTYNNPVLALSEFKPNFYDLLLTDINMPHMNGFELCEKILDLDANIRICFISAAQVNIEALREVYPKARSIGCFIKKPVTINYLVKRLTAELD